MEAKDWFKFKNVSEEAFKTAELQKCWGFQIQKGTTWNGGLDIDTIYSLETHFGFKFPIDYFNMLQVFNGFSIPQISIDLDGQYPTEFERRCYRYPEDLQKTRWLIEEANQHIEIVKECLRNSGFEFGTIEGFVPLYEHRVLTVLPDKTQSPVCSVWGDDIVLYGKSLIEYWAKEFLISY